MPDTETILRKTVKKYTNDNSRYVPPTGFWGSLTPGASFEKKNGKMVSPWSREDTEKTLGITFTSTTTRMHTSSRFAYSDDGGAHVITKITAPVPGGSIGGNIHGSFASDKAVLIEHGPIELRKIGWSQSESSAMQKALEAGHWKHSRQLVTQVTYTDWMVVVVSAGRGKLFNVALDASIPGAAQVQAGAGFESVSGTAWASVSTPSGDEMVFTGLYQAVKAHKDVIWHHPVKAIKNHKWLWEPTTDIGPLYSQKGAASSSRNQSGEEQTETSWSKRKGRQPDESSD